eukprot:310528-Chlamydomonas_euryale.AAC.1
MPGSSLRISPAVAAIASQSARSAGWPGAAANTHCSSWRRRANERADAAASVGNSASQPTTKVSDGRSTSTMGLRHSTSMSAYTPP